MYKDYKLFLDGILDIDSTRNLCNCLLTIIINNQSVNLTLLVNFPVEVLSLLRH